MQNRILSFMSFQFVKYATSGVAAFVIDFLSFIFCYQFLHFTVSVANVVAMLSGFIFGFSLYHYWVFKSNVFVVRTFFYMVLLLVTNMFVVDLCMYLLISNGLSPEASKFIMQISVVIWNFLLYKFVIFKR